MVGLWYGQAYVMDNEHRCILLMAFWTHRDTVTRSWGPLLCHSSTTITSCCSMIMHGPMLQGSVHNSWKPKTSQFLHGQHTHRTSHPLSMFGMLWIGVYGSVFQFLLIYSNFAQSLKRSGPTCHRPQSTTRSTLCEGDVLHCVRQMVVTPFDWFSDLVLHLKFCSVYIKKCWFSIYPKSCSSSLLVVITAYNSLKYKFNFIKYKLISCWFHVHDFIGQLTYIFVAFCVFHLNKIQISLYISSLRI